MLTFSFADDDQADSEAESTKLVAIMATDTVTAWRRIAWLPLYFRGARRRMRSAMSRETTWQGYTTSAGQLASSLSAKPHEPIHAGAGWPDFADDATGHLLRSSDSAAHFGPIGAPSSCPLTNNS